ncbi:MAG: hypothetical protein LBP59_14700 [Planctomycetaceae bacterium]|jgi:hypothetical protein|nr:hypothetical protein [Planctomycetaceae bacterium]
MKLDTTNSIIEFLNQLERHKIAYTISHYLNDSISICVVVPGERWEIDINQLGEIQIEIFRSNGEIYDSKIMETLFEKFSD